MHFHLPKPLHGWRAFVGEVAIIVLGVLIALGAEQAVQSIEWRQKVGAAVGDMNNELGSGDGPQAYGRLAMHDCIAMHLSSLRASIERGDRSESRKRIEQFWLPNRTWDSLAREAATAADVAAHMPHEQMLQYRIAYEMVPDMQRLAEKSLRIRATSELSQRSAVRSPAMRSFPKSMRLRHSNSTTRRSQGNRGFFYFA